MQEESYDLGRVVPTLSSLFSGYHRQGHKTDKVDHIQHIIQYRKQEAQRRRHPADTETLVIALAHQNRTIAIASDFRVDRAKSPEILQKAGVSGSEIATPSRKSLATFHRTLKSPKHRLGLFFLLPCKTKITLRGENNLRNVHLMLVSKGLFGGSLKITLQK